MRFSRSPSLGLLGLLFLLFVAVAHAASDSDLPQLSTLTQPNGASSTAASSKASDTAKSNSASATNSADSSKSAASFMSLTGLPTIAGAGVPTMIVPDTAAAPFMQKSNLPDGTVFICVGAALGFMGAAVLAWRGLVAWSLHRSVKRAAAAQNLADLKSMSAVPGSRKRNFYSAVGASSTMSLDRLSAAPTGHSRPGKPFAGSGKHDTPPKSQSSLFFSPTAGGATGLRDSVNRSSNYLPAGYYAAGTAAPASGSPMTTLGGHGAPSILSMGPSSQGYTRARSIGVSPPGSPSLPPSRGYDRAPPSRGESMYDPRKSVAGTIYTQHTNAASNLSLNVPGGTSVAGGRAPSAYLEDLFENHGNGPRERF